MLDRLRRMVFGTTKRIAKVKTGEEVSDRALRGFSRGNTNPDELLGDRGTTLALYDRMMLDDKISGIVRLKKSIALSCDWEIKGDSEETNDWAKEVLESLHGLSFADVLDNMLDAWIYGFKLAEIVWEYKDGALVPAAIKPKYSQRIEFKTDEFSNLEYAYIGGSESNKLDVTKPGKFLLFVHPYARDGNWYGQSDLSAIYREWKAKDALVKARTMFLEKFGAFSLKAVFEQKQHALLGEAWQILKDWQTFGVIRIPGRRDPKTNELKPLIDLSLIESSSRSADNYTAAIQELDKAIARKLLVPDKLGFTETPGGGLNSSDEMQYNIVLSDIRREHARLSDMVNEQLLKPLCEMNGKPECKLHFVGLTEGLTQTKATIIATLAGQPINKKEEWIREYLGVPPMDPALQEELDEMTAAIGTPAALPPAKAAAIEGKEPKPPQEPEGKVAQIHLQRKTPSNNYLDRINYARVENDLDEQEKPAVEAIVTALDIGVIDMIDWLKQREILDGKNIAFVERLPVPARTKRSFRWIAETLLGRSLFHGKESAAEEIAKAGRVKQTLGEDLGWKDIDDTDYLDRDWLKAWLKEHKLELTESDKALTEMAIQNAFTIAGVMEQDLLKTVKQTLFSNYGKVTGATLAARIREQVKDLGRARATNIVRTNASKYFNNGRYAEFAEAGDLVVGAQYSAILDDATTLFCEAHHGHFLLQSNPQYGLLPPAHYQCRSLVVAVFAGEDYTDNWNDVPADAMTPMVGFGA